MEDKSILYFIFKKIFFFQEMHATNVLSKL